MGLWLRSLVLAAATAVALPSAAAADTSHPAAAGDLAAHAEVLVWSPGPLAPSGPLMSGFGPGFEPLPVSSARLGGIDVGTDARGRTVLLYAAARDLYVYNFETNTSRRLSSLSGPGCAEGSPQISHGLIVFSRSGCRGFRAGLYLKRPGEPVRRLTQLPPPTQEVLQHRGITSFDLAGHTLAFVERRVGHELPIGSTWRVITQVRTLRLGHRRSKRLASGRKLESPTSVGVSLGQVHLDGGFVYWSRDFFNGCDSPDLPSLQDILRRPIDGSQRRTVLDRAGRLYAQSPCDALGTYAVTGGQLYYTFNDPRLRPPNASNWPPNAIGRADRPLVFR